MSESRVRIRANASTGELEIEATPEVAAEWWDRLWPQIRGELSVRKVVRVPDSGRASGQQASELETPEVFGEFYQAFRGDITDVDRMLVAAAFVQSKEPDRIFITKAANELLLDQGVKLSNPSEAVRRLVQGKRAFPVTDGKFRISALGFEYLGSLRVPSN